MQGCSYLLENHGEHHNIMVTIQLLIIVNASKIYKNGSKWYPAFIEFPFAKFFTFRRCSFILSSPAQAQFHCFSSLCH